MNISVVASYLEQLCREHKLVAHSDSEQHFVNLNDDKRATALVNELHYPAVYFEAKSSHCRCRRNRCEKDTLVTSRSSHM